MAIRVYTQLSQPKRLKVYVNDKPWVSKTLKVLTRGRKNTFRDRDDIARRDFQRQSKTQIMVMDGYNYTKRPRIH